MIYYLIYYPPPLWGRKGVGQKISKFQMHHRTKCDTSLESWYSEVSENILYNMFGNYPPFWGTKGGGQFFSKFQMHYRTKCDTSLESLCSEVYQNILWNMFVFLLIFANLWGGMGCRKKIKISKSSLIHHWTAGVQS